ncbi:MAG: riboflavin biosynthesis protein RibF [Opitutales bacterium]
MDFPVKVDGFEGLSGLESDLHLAIGVFDGVHLGHQAVIESAVASAGRSGLSGVLTFDPHPSQLFRPEDPTRLIMPIREKVAQLHQIGVDCVICQRFDREFASIPAEGFLAHLKDRLHSLKAIYVGENFRFGRKRSGDIGTLIDSGRQLGLGVFSADRIKHNGEPISSTRIRAELRAGRVAEANALLGYSYRSSGEIVAGAQLGRKLGFPTLNLPWAPECLPKFGVYLVQFREPGQAGWQPAVANYGVKPTVADPDERPCLELHALGSTELGPGQSIEVEWLRFIRAEQKFESVDALKAQIARDRETALGWAANV